NNWDASTGPVVGAERNTTVRAPPRLTGRKLCPTVTWIEKPPPPRPARLVSLTLRVVAMSPTFDTAVEPFVDRRNYSVPSTGAHRESLPREPQRERRQFANSYEELTPEARELAQAIDSYK